jgi:hypothetical protein
MLTLGIKYDNDDHYYQHSDFGKIHDYCL